MELAERFHKELHTQGHEQHKDHELLPVRLVLATAAVLPVDGAGVGIHGDPDLRTPLAASNEPAALVERLQFTVGRGPCLLATQLAFPVLATEELLTEKWPVLHDLLVGQTPIRSVLAIPLSGRLRGLGTLSLYFTDPNAGMCTMRVLEASRVAGLVSEHLGPAADWSAWTPTHPPAVVDTPDARRRGRVWVAVGMLMLSRPLGAADALALLRAQAYVDGRTVDDLAADLVEGRTTLDKLRGFGPAER